ncbi:DNA cytosine methyltransferase [Kribbella endophytica]
MASDRMRYRTLATRDRPEFESGSEAFRLVDLFAGCGGLTLGVAQAVAAAGAALEIPLAVDFNASATAVYEANFPKAVIENASVEAFFGDTVGRAITDGERDLAQKIGSINALVGGPPCQGHSNLNNHTRRNDPKNMLYGYMARAAEVLRPQVVLIENVPAVQHDKYQGRNVVSTVRQALSQLGYQVEDRVIALDRLGVAQRRKRHLLLATAATLPTPMEIFDSLDKIDDPHDLRWAIGDLEDQDGPSFDQAPRSSPENQSRMRYLLDNDLFDLPNNLRPVCHQNDDHSYKSMYGRLNWDKPAQTLTSGYGSIGQGRYMHPAKARALTPHEAARIQGFPDYFDFSTVTQRTDLATMIGNAVPPPLGSTVFGLLLPHLGFVQPTGAVA